jgi:sortase A
MPSDSSLGRRRLTLKDTVKTFFIQTRAAERVLFLIGLTFLTLWGGARICGALSSRAAIKRFEMDQAQASAESSWPVSELTSSLRVDSALWSLKRTHAYEESLTTKVNRPIAVLRIPHIQLEVPVYDGTNDLILNRGVGRILGTARVGEIGNLGIAGHRDGFFRGLKDLAPDDEIDLDRIGQLDIYVVEKIEIVNPEDVSVLAPTPAPTLTLVTCFPFYFVGSAPQRYIVTASLAYSGHPNKNAAEDFHPTGSKTNKKENGK